MANAENKSYEATEVWKYLDELRAAAGFESEGQFATAAGLLPSSISDWKRGKHVMSSLNLVRLIRAAAARNATAPLEAGEKIDPQVSILRRLAALEAKGADLATAEDVQTGFQSLEKAIVKLAPRRTNAASRKRKAS